MEYWRLFEEDFVKKLMNRGWKKKVMETETSFHRQIFIPKLTFACLQYDETSRSCSQLPESSFVTKRNTLTNSCFLIYNVS